MNGMMMPAVLIAAGAMIQDLKYRKISNKYLLICLAAAVCFRCVTAGGAIRLIIRDAAGGGVIPALLLGGLYHFRMIGGADIKLLMVLGILLGTGCSLTCVWHTVLFGAILSAGIMAAHRSGPDRFRYFGNYVSRYLVTGAREPYRCSGSWISTGNIHLTVPVLMAVLSLYM